MFKVKLISVSKIHNVVFVTVLSTVTFLGVEVYLFIEFNTRLGVDVLKHDKHYIDEAFVLINYSINITS